MALQSMTGFGAGAAEAALADGSTLSVSAELRTVNHRHLHAKLRLPQEFSALESALEARLRERIARGSVQASFDCSRAGALPAIEVDHDVAARYIAIQRDLGERFHLAPVAGVAEFLALPGVLVQSNGQDDAAGDAAAAEAFAAALDRALDALVEMRSAEGDALARDLTDNADAIAAIVADIERRAPGIVADRKQRLVERVAELAGDVSVAEADLAREIALLADRLDLSEEISRLGSHLGQLRALLGGSGAVGRKLDFLVQEFLREANTIGSKCSDADVAHLVVDLKTHVERLREQVQNVE